ncbi:MAG: dihydroorotate dehydrogenase electron transfer subunit [Euryarchaeota archaeon]|nr:dihydroorotate dehydrogenase electron transfer subunit [Euryarchaeota archaeon]
MYRVVKIEEIIDEAKDIKTFKFRDSSSPLPGQFYMVWLPGIDEFPMSISHIGVMKGFTVKKIGAGTSAMHALNPGDKLWIRGPYGRGFEIVDGTALVVGGGSGMATLAPLIESLPEPDVIIAARTADELLFTNRFKNANVHLATDDGSAGFKGFATQLAAKMLDEKKYEMIYTCGPEPMLLGMVELARRYDVKIQASLERLMKCGIGICDSCSINGYRVCVDGPVFSEELFSMDELGRVRRGPSGKKM